MRPRKLQIFVSSTYTDMVDLRLAAIEAILAAGHIPATMEQFTPGDETALEIIERWVRESDAFILLLGGRYGSLEPKSEKGYIQLEHELAVTLRKPWFSIIMSPEALQKRVEKLRLEVADERSNQAQYQAFKKTLEEKHCAYFDDEKDIKSRIFQKLPEWAARDDLVGWVRGNEAPSAKVAEELARLSAENAQLRQVGETFDGVTFDQLVAILKADETGPLFEHWMDQFAGGYRLTGARDAVAMADRLAPLVTHGLASKNRVSAGTYDFNLTPMGRWLRFRLLAMRTEGRSTAELWKR